MRCAVSGSHDRPLLAVQIGPTVRTGLDKLTTSEMPAALRAVVIEMGTSDFLGHILPLFDRADERMAHGEMGILLHPYIVRLRIDKP
jgi:hypothetical protein